MKDNTFSYSYYWITLPSWYIYIGIALKTIFTLLVFQSSQAGGASEYPPGQGGRQVYHNRKAKERASTTIERK